jgi:putative NADH-flavin reductase
VEAFLMEGIARRKKGEKMKLFIIGATGFVGSEIVREALDRGHSVSALTRDPAQVKFGPSVSVVRGDIFDSETLAGQIAGHDAVIHSYAPSRSHPDRRGEQIRATTSIIGALKRAGVKRILAVGGAGTLETSPGVRLMDTPELPREWTMGAISTAEIKYLLEKEPDLEWTSLSPSLYLVPGERTGKFRLGTDQVLRDESGQSRISVQDYAVAMLDELEVPRHMRRRFTVGY